MCSACPLHAPSRSEVLVVVHLHARRDQEKSGPTVSTLWNLDKGNLKVKRLALAASAFAEKTKTYFQWPREKEPPGHWRFGTRTGPAKSYLEVMKDQIDKYMAVRSPTHQNTWLVPGNRVKHICLNVSPHR